MIDSLTVDDFKTSDWRLAVEAAGRGVCELYSSQFRRMAEQAKEESQQRYECLFTLLSNVSSMMLNPDDPKDPFKPMAEFRHGRSMIPSDLTEAELLYIAAILPETNDPDLQARLADLLWVTKRDYKSVSLAVESYLASAIQLGEENWPDAADRIDRAAELAARVSNVDLRTKVVECIVSIIDSINEIDSDKAPSFYAAKLMAFLQELQVGDASKYCLISEGYAKRSEAAKEWHRAREYWEVAAKWHQIRGSSEGYASTRIMAAETYVSEAEQSLNVTAPSYMVAAHWLESAIQALKKIEGQQIRIEELHARLLGYQKQALTEMNHFSHSFDVTDLLENGINSVKGKTLIEGLFALALIGNPPKVETLEAQAREHQQEFVLSSIFGTTFINEMGRTIARRDARSLGVDEPDDLRIEMYKNAGVYRSLQAQLVDVVRRQICLEHPVRVDDLVKIVVDNPFVPHGRETSFARGLHAGMHGDFMTATHLLVPQFENSIRYILSQEGVITSGLDDNGIQDELDLNRTLKLPKCTQPLAQMLGSDTVFDLRGLLVERYGANLRNDCAHGLLSDGRYHSAPCIYLWWITLRLCCIPIINRQVTHEVSD